MHESNIEFSLSGQRPIEISFLTTEAIEENSLPNRKMMLFTSPTFFEASFIHLFSTKLYFEIGRRDISDKNSSPRREKKTLYRERKRGVREKEIPWNYLSDIHSAVKIASPAFNQS
ncbi:hypothetical protein CEXT_506531 [Caerostris extrusa]|uniref:Uncharacterized protein n=1 Tax=Caerostris extrusa TaxID=172846 RepID=A0AAV4QTE1_CAEEX|nr:hypothetical protein CEXT_506531 [Caerostris extrusa]